MSIQIGNEVRSQNDFLRGMVSFLDHTTVTEIAVKLVVINDACIHTNTVHT